MARGFNYPTSPHRYCTASFIPRRPDYVKIHKETAHRTEVRRAAQDSLFGVASSKDDATPMCYFFALPAGKAAAKVSIVDALMRME
jgi:hypothetical protein